MESCEAHVYRVVVYWGIQASVVFDFFWGCYFIYPTILMAIFHKSVSFEFDQILEPCPLESTCILGVWEVVFFVVSRD